MAKRSTYTIHREEPDGTLVDEALSTLTDKAQAIRIAKAIAAGSDSSVTARIVVVRGGVDDGLAVFVAEVFYSPFAEAA